VNLGHVRQLPLLSEPLTGNGAISARIDSQTNTSAWAKAGVMMRATSDPGSPYFAAFMTPSNGIAVQWRTTQGGSSSQVTTAGVVPAWLEVAQSNGTFTAYTSSDGLNWTAIPNASVNLGLTGTILAASPSRRHNTSQLSTGTFDTITLGPRRAAAGGLPDRMELRRHRLTRCHGRSRSLPGPGRSRRRRGHLVDGRRVPLRLADAPDGRVDRGAGDLQANTSAWAKAGVMLRSSTDPGSPYYAAFVTPGNGIAIQWRTTLAGTSSQLLAAGGPPVFLAGVDVRGTATAYYVAGRDLVDRGPRLRRERRPERPGSRRPGRDLARVGDPRLGDLDTVRISPFRGPGPTPTSGPRASPARPRTAPASSASTVPGPTSTARVTSSTSSPRP